MLLIRPFTKFILLATIICLASCSATEDALKIAEDGQRTLCTPSGCVDLFGDYETAEIKHLHPAYDKQSFAMLAKNSKSLSTFSTFMEPHFSGFTLTTECVDCDSGEFGKFLETNGAKNLEMHQLKGKSENIWVANYQCQSTYYGALAYFRELLCFENGQTFRFVFWTFDHPQILKSETIRIFETFNEKKPEAK